MDAPAGLLNGASMGDLLGDVTGIIDFDFTDRKLFVTADDAAPETFGPGGRGERQHQEGRKEGWPPPHCPPVYS